MAKYLDNAGLTYFWGKIKAWVGSYVNITSSTGKDTIKAGTNSVDIYDWAQASTKPTYTANEVGALSSSTSIPSKTSDLTNDSGFITTSDIPEGAAASTTTPLMDGTAAVGTELAFARGDHRHPSDTTKADKSTTVSNVAYDSTNNKITKTINGTTSDVVTASTLKTAMSLNNVENKSSATIRGELTSSNVTTALGYTPINSTAVGAASGVCPLDANTKIDSQYLPSYVDDVIEAYARTGQTALSSTWLATGSASGAAITPEAGKIYVLMADSGDYTANSQFRWGGTTYVKLNDGGVSAITNSEIDTITAN